MGRDGRRLYSCPVHTVAAQQPKSALDGGRGDADAILVSGWRQHHRGATVVVAAPPLFQGPAAGRDGGHGGADVILVRGRRQHH